MIREALQSAKRLYTRAKLGAKRRLDLFDEPDIVPFDSHGTREWLEVKGRVHEQEPLYDADEDAPVWRNALNTVFRVESDEIPGARLRLYADGQIVEARTDDEGFFRERIQARRKLAPGWHEVTVELVESIAGGEGLRRVAPVLVPDMVSAELAVVSDLDDTVIQTGATELLATSRTSAWSSVRRSVWHGKTTSTMS